MGFLDSLAGFAVGGATGGAVGASGSGFGSFMGDVLSGGGISQANAQQAANEANVGMAREQMAFQERMSSSAYQRAMMDMSKAGLNPMLAFSQGGASSPSGASATVSPVNKAPGKIASSAISGVQALASGVLQAKNLDSQTNLNSQNADVSAAKIGETRANEDLKKDQATNLVQERQNARINEKILKERHRASAAEADEAEMSRDIQKSRQHIDKGLAPYDAGLERVEQAVGAITNGRNAFRSRKRPSYKTMDVNPGTGEVFRERHYQEQD